MMITENNDKYQDLLKDLTANCDKCTGICCVSLYFSKSEGFPSDKNKGTPCKHLMPDFRCDIHSKLMQHQLKGCMGYDCFGAGQKVTQSIYKRTNWRSNPKLKSEIFEVFLLVYQLHQIMWYLVEAWSATTNNKLCNKIDLLIHENQLMTNMPPNDLLSIDIESYKIKVNQILKQVSKDISSKYHKTKPKSTDFIGRDLQKINLIGKDLSMTLLIAANLSNCNLTDTNFLGADMRDTDIRNSDLSKSLFITQRQINAAKGNLKTKLPKTLTYPVSWQL